MAKKIIYSLFFCLVFGLIFQISNNVVMADTGDFYDRHKNLIENREFSENFRELIEDYDYDTNSFDCGMTDFYCKTVGTYYEAIIGINLKMYTTIETLSVTPAQVMDDPQFKRFKIGLSDLSNIMLMIFIMWHAMTIVAQSLTNPESGAIALNQKIVKLIGISIVLFQYDQFMNLFISIVSFSFRAVISAPFSMERTALMIFMNGRFGVILALLVSMALVVFYVSFTYRLVLYGFLYAVGVVAIPTALNEEYDYFSLWLRQMINNGVTIVSQGITFSLGFQQLVDGKVTMGFALMILTLSIPSILGQLGASSGSSRAMATILRTVARR